MKELLVMRHAKSDWHAGESDFNRPLNERGVLAADQMAMWLNENDLVPDRVVSSPAVRARSTAMAVVHGCEIDRRNIEFVDELYLADAFTWLQVLSAQTADRLLICGHNPGLDELVDYLAAIPAKLTASGKLMTTAAIAHFRFGGESNELTRGSGDLVSLTRPRDIGPDH